MKGLAEEETKALHFKPLELIIKTNVPGSELHLGDDPEAKVDENGDFHYRIEGFFFEPPVHLLQLDSSENREICKLLSRLVTGLRKGDLETVKALYHPESAEKALAFLKSPEKTKQFLEQYEALVAYDLCLAIRADDSIVAFSRMESSSRPGMIAYPFLGLTDKSGELKVEYVRVNPKMMTNLTMALQKEVLEVREPMK